MGTTLKIAIFFTVCHRLWLSSNPRPWDDVSSVLPLCYTTWDVANRGAAQAPLRMGFLANI